MLQVFMYRINAFVKLNTKTEQGKTSRCSKTSLLCFALCCVFTCVAPTLFKILGTALHPQSHSLDTLDWCSSLLVFKVAVSHSSSAVRVCFTSGKGKLSLYDENPTFTALSCRAGLAVQV